MPLTEDMTELLGKIMSQVLSILALSTKKMTDGRMSELDRPLYCSSMANCGAEKILKKLAGSTDVEDAVLQLDMLTKEESLMVVARNLEVTHRVDGNVEATKVLTEDIDSNVKATKAVTEDVSDNVNATKALTEDIGDNVNATKALTEDIGDNVKATKALTEDIGDNVKTIDHDLKTTKDSKQRLLSRLLTY
jgi:methyl-accepting chemotaxis protein